MQSLILQPKRERSLINRHPWVFSGAVKQLPKAENGEIVKVVSNDGALLGYGFFSANSQITCRVFEICTEERTIEKQYWTDKINNAMALRRLAIDFEHTNIYRLIHAEGDFFPGVIIDIYADVAVVQLLIRGTEL